MNQKNEFLRLTGSLLLMVWMVVSLAGCSGGETTSESVSPTSPVSTAAPAADTPSIPAVGATSPAPQDTHTPDAPPSATAPAPTATVAPTATASDPRQAIIAAMNAMREAGRYRVDVTSTGSGITTKWKSEVILPDRFHLFMDIGEYIIIADKTYFKQGGVWIEFPVDFGSLVFPLLISSDEEAEASISDAQRIGPDTVNGEATTVYQYRSTGEFDGTQVSSMVKLWVRDSDNLPVRQEINGEADGVESTTIQEIEYDPTISIEPPTGS